MKHITISIQVASKMEPATPNEEANWHTIQRLLERATSALQDLFRRLFAAANGGVAWVDGADQAAKFLARKGVNKLVSSLGRIQRSQVETGIVSRWDISLLRALPPITTVRNNISHLAELKVDQKSFDQWKKLLKTSLLSFDIDSDEIEQIISAAGSATSTTSRSETMTEAEKSKFEAEKAAGNAAFKAGQYDTAIEHYSNALSVPLSSVNCAMILSNRSFCFIKKAERNPGQSQYNFLKALQDAKEAVSAHPAWGKGYYRKGVCYLGLGKPEKAKLDLDKAVALMPEDPDVQRVRATAVDRVHSRLRKDHLNPQMQQSIPDQIQRFEQQMGMPEMGLGGVSGVLATVSQALRSVGDRAALGLLDLYRAHALRDGFNCVADEHKAYQLYKSAADVGVIEAKYNLAVLTLKGRGCPPDPMASLRMMHEIVEQPGTLTSKNAIVLTALRDSSNPIPGMALYSISLHYSNGIAVPRDLFKAFEWIEKAAQAGSAQGYDALGLAYWSGDGVARDIAKAKQCLETAVKKGDVNALVNLASLHVSGLDSAVPDFDSARRLLEEAKKRGHGAADEILARLPPASSEKTAALNKLAAEQPAAMELLKEMRMMMEKKAKPVKAGRRNTAELPDSIAGSSPYARMLQTAVVHWSECMSLFEKLTSGSSESTEIFQCLIFEFYRATELADYICGWPSEFFSRLAPIAEVFYSKNPHRSDVAYFIAASYLSMGDDRCLPFFEQAAKKFPSDWILNHLYACALGFGNRYEDAAAVSRATLARLNPKTDGHKFWEEAYVLGASYRITTKFAEAIEAYDMYEKWAPMNHRKRPEAVFAKFYCKMMQEKDMGPFIGPELKAILEQEPHLREQQLPHFRDDAWPSLDMLKHQSKLFNFLQSQSSSNTVSSHQSSGSQQPFDTSSMRLTHPYRIERIVASREYDATMRSGNATKVTKTPAFSKSRVQRNYSADSSKPITLNEIEASTDRIYEGRVLKARVVNAAFPPLPDGSLFCGIEDEEGTYEAFSMTKWYERFATPSEAANAFCSGRRIAIVNPYHRLAADGKVMIRVDDSDSVIVNTKEDIGPVCCCCTKSLEAGSVLRCAKCETAIYCSKECQVIDWKQHKHQIICDTLKAAWKSPPPQKRHGKKKK